MPEDINFCQRCGHALAEKEVADKMRPYCPGCGQVVFLDPKVVAVVLVLFDGKLVLVRRAVGAAKGRWGFPSGYVDRGEAVEDAATREVSEETGLAVCVDRLVGLYSGCGDRAVLAVYSAHVVGGGLQPGPEVQEVALFPVDELPPLPFPHDDQILDDWRALALGMEGRPTA